METGPVPSPQQLDWQEAGLSLFLHFGMNTFTNREWGEGTESPALFQPTDLDCRQWARTAAEAGFRYAILTAKHHDGFCLWPSRYTEHSVKNSPWRNGKGDVMREFADACREARLKLGFYLSPWDRHEPTYGDSPAYNRHFVNQLTELLTQYGEVAEVWFDGANGEGPNGKRQEYDWHAYFETIRKHQPKALIAICGPDIRWVGNEDGFAQETEWSVQDANPTFHPGKSGKVWWPSECDVSIRPGWFWHAAEDEKVKSLAHLMDIYYRSVGHNSVLLLNVPPNNRGLLPEPDVRRLREFRAARDAAFAKDLARGAKATAESEAKGFEAARAMDGNARTAWSPTVSASPVRITFDLGREVHFSVVRTQELVSRGQRVEEYLIEKWQDGRWQEIKRGTTIGHTKLDRVGPTQAQRVRLTILKARGAPYLRSFGLFDAPLL
jgi:alpha-L-fucosidase